MNRTPQLDPAWATNGFLYTADNPAALGEDMFAAWLPDGTTIEAGWSSEGDPNGCYEVRVMRGFDDVFPRFSTPNIDSAVTAIQRFSAEVAAPVVNVSHTPRNSIQHISLAHRANLSNSASPSQTLIKT